MGRKNKDRVLRFESTHNVRGPGQFRFQRGLNEFVAKDFEKMLSELDRPGPDGLAREMLAFHRLFDDGILRPADKPAERVPDTRSDGPGGEPPGANSNESSGLPKDEAEAVKAVLASSDSAQLEAWFDAEKRDAVSDAIVTRLRDLDAGSGSKAG